MNPMHRPRTSDRPAVAALFLLGLIVFLAAAMLFAFRASGADAPPTPVVGVWFQPASSFAKWKARGINTLVGYEGEGGNVSVDQWCAAAQAAGLKYVLQRGADSDRHAIDWNCAGWLLGDEPNGGGNETPAQVQADYAAAKAIANRPVLVNLDGPGMRWQDDALIAAYCKAADWLAVDYYPINRGEGDSGIAQIGFAIDRIKRLAPGKPVLAFVETSNQNLIAQGWPPPSATGPTVAQVQAEVQQLATHHADGLLVFPDVIGRNFEAFDGTPDGLAGAMPAIWTPYVAFNPPAPSVPRVTAAPASQPAPPSAAAPPAVAPPAVAPPAMQPAGDLTGSILISGGRAYYLRGN